jgi:hypothetical protein
MGANNIYKPFSKTCKLFISGINLLKNKTIITDSGVGYDSV